MTRQSPGRVLKRASGRFRRTTRRLVRGPSDQQVLNALVASGVAAIGVGSYGAPRIVAFEPKGSTKPYVSIGRFCSIAQGVTFVVNGDHRTDWVTTYPLRMRFGLDGANADGHPKNTGPVIVQHDVWIGFNATIMGGVTVGSGAVIAAGSLVTKDVRPFAIVGCVPARELRRRFDDETIQALLDVAWWDLEPDEVTGLAGGPMPRTRHSEPQQCGRSDHSDFSRRLVR